MSQHSNSTVLLIDTVATHGWHYIQVYFRPPRNVTDALLFRF